MSQAPAPGRGPLNYSKARGLTLTAGFALLVVLAAFMLYRGVDTIEVSGILLFVIVFIGFIFWNLPGGIIGGFVASAIYAALRYRQFEALGSDQFIGLILARSIGYLAFGAIGGISNRQMQSSLTKLELYDQIDDSTGIYNARFFLQDTDLELSRATRYKTIFSVCVVDVPATALEQLSKRQRAGTLREMGRMLKDSVRTVDRAAHGASREAHRFGVVLPETGREGVQVFTHRLADRLADYLIAKGAPLRREDIGRISVTLPEDEVKLKLLREEFQQIARSEHPGKPDPSSAVKSDQIA